MLLRMILVWLRTLCFPTVERTIANSASMYNFILLFFYTVFLHRSSFLYMPTNYTASNTTQPTNYTASNRWVDYAGMTGMTGYADTAGYAG